MTGDRNFGFEKKHKYIYYKINLKENTLSSYWNPGSTPLLKMYKKC